MSTSLYTRDKGNLRENHAIRFTCTENSDNRNRRGVDKRRLISNNILKTTYTRVGNRYDIVYFL